MDKLRCVAVDLGAGSCRVSLAEWDGSQASVHLAHRYPNGPVEREGHLWWRLDPLCDGADEGLDLASRLLTDVKGGMGGIDSVGVDGWAVDYVRLDQSGKPMADPLCYRDQRTETAMPEVWAKIPQERLYELTGIQFLRFNTLYQLYADLRDGLEPGAQWLNVPEYLLFRFAGYDWNAAVSEYTNATHTQLVNARTRNWCDEIFEKVGLNRSAASRIVPPGTQLGPLRSDAAALDAYKAARVIAAACHDTGAAVAGIPDATTEWAFISSGTWSLVGALLDEPCTSAAALRENFTNEGGAGGRIRFLKNVNGMWLLEECLREWNSAGTGSWSVAELVAECEKLPVPETLFNVDAPQLIVPGHMPSRINRELEKAGHAPLPEDPENAPRMAAVIFASLAARYAEVLRALKKVTGRKFHRLYVVGGGSQNEYVNHLIADYTSLEVRRGPVESSTIGNLAIQFASLESGNAEITAADVARWGERLVRSSAHKAFGGG
jgi:rhamnulokinase